MEVSQLSFEAALARLEEIVRSLEKGEAPLDRSIELYQEGDRLKRHCEARLKDAQARIEQMHLAATASQRGSSPSMPVETVDRLAQELTAEAAASAPMSTNSSRSC